ncbi:MAG TPA: efflux RND transporter permease subunit, partial [Thermoanaerobaculia bacterium]|nr:efflux RND transporter permease subunit [Thermoanaerobaculia bacterium]
DVETLASVNREPAVALVIRKQSGTNTIAVIDRLKQRIKDLSSQLPANYRLAIVRDQSTYIQAAVDAVKEHLLVGSLFAAAVVWLFLRRLRPTLIAAVAIPASLVATFGAMAYMGFTLNVITLLALTLAVGIVIDDAVVVIENVFRFLEEKKLSPREAAVEGTKEVGLAVLATSLSLIAVFLPVAFMGGIVGRFMNSFGVTMAFAIGVSLLVSFTLTPMMASRWLSRGDASEGGGHSEGSSGSRAKGFYPYVERTYLALLSWSMRHRWVVVLLMFGVFLSTFPLGKLANKNFLPKDDESQFEVNIRAPEGTSLATTGQIVESVAARVRELPEVSLVLTTLAGDQQRTQNFGSVYVQLKPTKEREKSQFDVMDDVRAHILPAYSKLGLRTAVGQVNAFSSGNNQEIQFWIGGPNLDKLAEYSAVLAKAVRETPGTVDVDTNLIVGKPELGVHIDREKATDLGVRVEDLASTLNILVGGLPVTDYYEGGEQYEVHVRAAPEDRRDASTIAQTEVPSSKVGTVRLSDVVRLDEGTGPSLVNRINRRRQVLIYANMQPGFSAQAVIDRLNETVKKLNMPAEYSYGLTGRSREQGKAAVNFLVAFVLSIIFMYLILAAQFESWIHPVTILLALPMTVPFALFSIVMLNESLNIFSSLGILVLFGIVKKNGILQIDHTNQLRAQGLPREEAILHANRDRLRPILMTTLAFVAGMIPLVVSSGTGAGTNRSIGTVILGGQTLALLLTLIATPVMYSIFDDWGNAPVWGRLRSLFSRRRSAEDEDVITQVDFPTPVARSEASAP